jgi:hypothetical protein
MTAFPPGRPQARSAALGRSLVVAGLVCGWMLFPLTDSTAAAAESAADVAGRAGISEVTQTWSLAVADYDGDGRDDLFVGRHQRAARLYRDDGSHFTAVDGRTFAASDRHSCVWGDVDDDGAPDVFCSVGAHQGTAVKANQLWIQHPNHTFVDRAREFGVTDRYGRGRESTFVDFNHDRYPDLFVGNFFRRKDRHPSWNRLYVNRGGRRYRERTIPGLTGPHGSTCAQAADVDGDGWEDLLVCGRRRLLLYRNRHGGGFHQAAGAWNISGVATSADLADVNGDGALDLVRVGRLGLRVQLQGAGRFHDPVVVDDGREGVSVAAGDLDGDGAVDLYFVRGCVSDHVDAPDRLLRNTGGGTRYRRIRSPRINRGCGDVAAPIDYDGDRADELVVANGGGYRNTAHPGPVQLIDIRP